MGYIIYPHVMLDEEWLAHEKESRQIREEAMAILMGVLKRFNVIKMHRRRQHCADRRGSGLGDE